MTGAGELDRRIRFEKRLEAEDGFGNEQGSWAEQFECWAKRQFLRGGEQVIASRLESRQPAILTVRNSVNTRMITSEWRAIDKRDGRIFNIREDPKESDDRAMLEMLAEAGVPT